MLDEKTTVSELKSLLQKFCDERDWGKFHTAKDLAIGVVTEGSELLEPFRFLSLEQQEELLKDPERRLALGDELADVLFFILRFSQRFDFDISQHFFRKMKKNAAKYPVEAFRGKNHKSTLSVSDDRAQGSP